MSDYDVKYLSKFPERFIKNGGNFRLVKSCEILTKLEKEEKHYEGVRKKYNRVRNVFQNLCVGSGGLSVILSMSGLGTSLSGFGIIIGIPLGVIGWILWINFYNIRELFKKIGDLKSFKT